MTIAIVSEGGFTKTCAPTCSSFSSGANGCIKDEGVNQLSSSRQFISSLAALSVIALAAVLSMGFTGCAMTPGPADEAMPERPAGPMYKVIFGTSKGKEPVIFNGYIEGNPTVQDALKASGATKKFKHMRIDLARRLENGQVLKMPVNFNPNENRVIDEQNYALHPGDELLVRRESPGMFDAMFKSIPGNKF